MKQLRWTIAVSLSLAILLFAQVYGYGPVIKIIPYSNGSATGQIRFMELNANGTNYVALQSPTTLAANNVTTLPAADGTNGQAIITNGAGALSFATIGGGGGGTVTDVFGTTNEIASSGGIQPVISVASTFDISGKTSTKSVKTATSPPATCAAGALYFNTAATAGQNLYGCTATNVWTLLGDGVGSSVPAATIAFFNLGSCPSGWSEYSALRGRYAVGLVASGTLEGTSGTALTNIESRVAGTHLHSVSLDASHNHTVADPVHTHTYTSYTVSGNSGPGTGGGNTTFAGSIYPNTSASSTGLTVNTKTVTVSGNTGNTGSVAGTPAPYIQLLACRKN